jgi:Protein of unknown function (DUF4089)
MQNTDFDWATYVNTMTALYQITLDKERHAELVLQLQRVHQIAGPLLEFMLADDIESAPTFRP